MCTLGLAKPHSVGRGRELSGHWFCCSQSCPHLLSVTLYLHEIELTYLEHGKHDRVGDNEAPK